MALTAEGARAVEQFADLLEVTDVATAFYAMGRSYDSFRKILMRSGRVDLVSKLTEWKREDAVRLRHALGLQWQA